MMGLRRLCRQAGGSAQKECCHKKSLCLFWLFSTCGSAKIRLEVNFELLHMLDGKAVINRDLYIAMRELAGTRGLNFGTLEYPPAVLCDGGTDYSLAIILKDDF